jgi:cellulose synthase (UDP-forming)
VLDVLAVNLMWAAYNATVCTAALAVAVEGRQVREAPRVPARIDAMVRMQSGRTLRAVTRDLCLGGGSIELAAPEEIESAGPLWVSLLLDGREVAARARVISREGTLARVQFDDLALEDEALLVRAIFSRADAWVGWLPERRRDRPLRELLAVGRAALALPRRIFATRAARGGAA